MGFFVRYFRSAVWKASNSLPSPVVVGWHNEAFASEREAIERGCELIEQGIVFITVAPIKGDPLDGVFIPLDAEGLKRHQFYRHRR